MKKNWPLILIILFGILIRYYHNLDISLWHDEAFSALLIKYPWNEMMFRIGLDVHPPMYYIFLRFWHYLFGDSLFSLRSFSIFFSVGTVWAAWIFVKEAFKNERAALLAAVLVAINPFGLKFATEARMYTFGAFFALLAAYFLIKALNQQKQLHQDCSLNIPNLPADIHLKKKMVWSFIGFILSMVIIIYTHYYLFFTAAALGFYGLLYLFFHHKWDYKKYIPLLSTFIIIAITFLPWLKTFLYQYKQVGAGYWIPPINLWSIPSTFWDMLLGFGRDLNKSSTQLWLAVITLFTLFIFVRFIRKTESFHKWLVVLAVGVPFLGALMFAFLAKLKGSQSSVYLDRYFLFAGVFYSIVLAVWLKEIKIKWLAASLIVIYIFVNLFAFWQFWKDLDVKTKPGMAKAINELRFQISPGDKLYVGSSFMFFNLKYYLGQYNIPNKPLLFSGGATNVDSMPHYAGTAILKDNDLLPAFSREVTNGDTVWLIWTNGFGANKPEVPINWKEIEQNGKAYAEVRPYVSTYVYVTQYKVN